MSHSPSTKRPKVAVVTRTKNRPALLERAIKSVHQQTMNNFVHVIVNDGGDTKTFNDVIRKYESITRGHIKILQNSQSIGMEAASNKAIRSTDTDYIAIHDDDDSWHPDFLKETTLCLEETGSMGVIVKTVEIYEDIIGDSIQEYDRKVWLPKLRTLNLYSLCIENFVTTISFLYKREVLSKIGYYDESLPVLGDWEFAIRFMREYDIEFLRDGTTLAFHHQRPSSEDNLGNSIYYRSDLVDKYLSIIANRLLREDFKRGGLGAGYIFSKQLHKRQNPIVKERNKQDEIINKLAEVENTIITRTDYRRKAESLARRLPMGGKIAKVFIGQKYHD